MEGLAGACPGRRPGDVGVSQRSERGDDYDISEIARQDIQDRFGTFLAIRCPDDVFEKYDGIVFLQDLFPVIFAYLFEDAKILGSRIDPRTFQAERVSCGWKMATSGEGCTMGSPFLGESIGHRSDESST